MPKIVQLDSYGSWTVGTFLRVVMLVIVSLILFFTILFNSPVYIVDQGERAIITRMGVMVGSEQPGPHFKTPVVEQANYISIQPQTYTFDKLQAYSQDQQPADIRLSVTIQVRDPETLYTQFHTLENFESRVLAPRVPQAVKVIFGQFNAASAIQNRAKMDQEITQAVINTFANTVVTVVSVQVENINFSDAYEHAVESQMQAVVAQRTAEAEANRVKIKADAEAYKATKEGEGQASAIRARGDALKENPGIPALVAAEKWDGHLPSTMPPNGTVPFLQLQNSAK